MEIKKLRSITGLSQSKFAAKYQIPLRTVQSWESEAPSNKRNCPTYVYEMLKTRVESDYIEPDIEKKLKIMYNYTKELSTDDITTIAENEADPNARLFYTMLVEYLAKEKKDE
jgi:DNA-binding XRE family transcriptional regulator